MKELTSPKQWCVREREVDVPLDHARPDGPRLGLFVREVTAPGAEDAPWLVYLQGGPGVESPRDLAAVAWLPAALARYRVLLLDQRGTGRSTPVEPELAETFAARPDEFADYLSHFRANAIVDDLEWLRLNCYDGAPWTLLGQSFGGFVACRYLSAAPHGLVGVMICGGLPPLRLEHPRAVYDVIAANVAAHSAAFYRHFPAAADTVRDVLSVLAHEPVRLDDGGWLTPERFLDLGMLLGGTDGDFTLNALLDDPFADRARRRLRWRFTERVRRALGYELNPLFVILHEAVYCDGDTSQWAAEAAMADHGGFYPQAALPALHGETMRPAVLDEYARLRPYRQVAERLAHWRWAELYDHERLAANTVPVEAIVYERDFYVEASQSLATAEHLGACRVWRHPDWAHDALRRHGGDVLEPLMRGLAVRAWGDS